MYWVLIGSAWTIVYLSQLCHGYSLECHDNCLFISIMSWVLIGTILPICLPYVMGIHWGCFDNCLFVSNMSWVCIWGSYYNCKCVSRMSWVLNGGCPDICLCVSIVSWVLIGGVVTIVFLSPLRHGYSLRVSWQLFNYLHYVMGTHWGYIVSRLLVSIMSWVLIGSVLTIVFLLTMRSWVLIGGLLTIVYLFPWCHGYSFEVSWQSSTCFHVMGTHLGCLDICLFVPIMSCVLIGVSFQWSFCLYYDIGTLVGGGVFPIVYLSSICMGSHYECLMNGLFVFII